MARIYRELSDDIKKKISDALKKHYAEKGTEEKRKANRNKSEALKRYWANIPSTKNEDATITDAML